MKSFLVISSAIASALCLLSILIPQIVGTREIENNGDSNSEELKSKLLLSFVIFRHGDRTPDPHELEQYPSAHFNNSIFYPYGKKALTNRGKQRAFSTGKYLRARYNGTISELYLSNEISVRSTDLARTKMSALSVLAGMYPPLLAQKWNLELNWQPIPYDTMPAMDDDFLFYLNCPRYRKLSRSVFELPEVREIIKQYEDLFKFLSEKTGANIRIPRDVLFLDNLFQTLNNTGVILPQWVQELMPKIKEVSSIDYFCLKYNKEIIRFRAGVFMNKILDSMKAYIDGYVNQPVLRLYSGHEDNVAALLAATGVFNPHQPKYGSTASLELRQNLETGKYEVMVVYAAEAGGPGIILPIADCGGKPLCDFDTFVTLTKHILMDRNVYKKECSVLI